MANFVAKLDSLQQQLVFLPYVLSNEGVYEYCQYSASKFWLFSQDDLACLHDTLTETERYS